MPIESGGTASSYITDYHWLAQGNKILAFGGYFEDSNTAGLWFWSLDNKSSKIGFDYGARILRYN